MTFYHKPVPVTRMMNSVMGWFASVGLAPPRHITLQVRGRRSGRVRSTVVTSVDHDGQRYLVSPRGETEWVRNVRAGGGEALIRRRGRQKVRLEEVPPDKRAVIIRAYLKRNTLNAPFTKPHFGLDPEAPLPEFEAIAARHPVFKITPT